MLFNNLNFYVMNTQYNNNNFVCNNNVHLFLLKKIKSNILINQKLKKKRHKFLFFLC